MLVFQMQLTALVSTSDSLVLPASIKSLMQSWIQCSRQHLTQLCWYLKCHILRQQFQSVLFKKRWWKSSYLKKMILCGD